MDKLDFKGTFAQFVKGCQDPNSGHYYASKGELLEAYQALCTTISAMLPSYFDRIPAAPLEIVAKDSETAPAAYVGVPCGTLHGVFAVILC